MGGKKMDKLYTLQELWNTKNAPFQAKRTTDNLFVYIYENPQIHAQRYNGKIYGKIAYEQKNLYRRDRQSVEIIGWANKIWKNIMDDSIKQGIDTPIDECKEIDWKKTLK